MSQSPNGNNKSSKDHEYFTGDFGIFGKILLILLKMGKNIIGNTRNVVSRLIRIPSRLRQI